MPRISWTQAAFVVTTAILLVVMLIALNQFPGFFDKAFWQQFIITVLAVLLGVPFAIHQWKREQAADAAKENLRLRDRLIKVKVWLQDDVYQELVRSVRASVLSQDTESMNFSPRLAEDLRYNRLWLSENLPLQYRNTYWLMYSLQAAEEALVKCGRLSTRQTELSISTASSSMNLNSLWRTEMERLKWILDSAVINERRKRQPYSIVVHCIRDLGKMAEDFPKNGGMMQAEIRMGRQLDYLESAIELIDCVESVCDLIGNILIEID